MKTYVRREGSVTENIIGQKFGRLIVLDEKVIMKSGQERRCCLCRCNCSKEIWVRRDSLVRSTRSCGCLIKETNRKRITKHGLSHTKEYNTWYGMVDRCNNIQNKNYPAYGGRGITVYASWQNSFEAFLKDVGKCPARAKSLDRIDNNGPYAPGNVRWTTDKTQANNRRTNYYLTYNGEVLSLSEMARKYGLSRHVLSYRCRAGWAIADAIMCPIRRKRANFRN